MSHSIDFNKYTPHAAAVAISWAVIPPVGALSTFGTMALSTLSIFGIETLSKQWEKNLSKQWEWAFHKWSYKIAPRYEYDLTSERFQTAFSKAFQRVTTLKSYKWFKKDCALRTDEDAMKSLRNLLNEGTCLAEATCLLEKISRTDNPLSFQESLKEMTAEAMIFQEMVNRLYTIVSTRINKPELFVGLKKNAYEEKKILPKLANFIQTVPYEDFKTPLENYIKENLNDTHKIEFERLNKKSDSETPILSDEQIEEHIQEFSKKLRKKTNDCLDELKKLNCMLSAHESPNFTPTKSWFSYQFHIEQFAKSQAISQENIKGIVCLPGHPGHAIAFELAPKNYIIYDPAKADAGLFQYPDKQAFFEGMRLLVLTELEDKNSSITFRLL